MEILPNEPANRLVTRDDMHAFGTGLRGEMAELRGELVSDMAELRTELRGDMAELRGDMVSEMAALRGHVERLVASAVAANAVAVVTVLVS